MKILLFDWRSGGHHATYVRRFAEALSRHARVIAAVPDWGAAMLSDCEVELFPMGPEQPSPDYSRPLGPQNRERALYELDLLDRAVAESKPNHIIHMYSDSVIRRIVKRPPYPAPVTLCLFWPRAHYPSMYRTPLDMKEWLRAWFLEYLVLRWRNRHDAHCVFALDENVPPRWNRFRGPRVYWLPEPPVKSPAVNNTNRSGCILYGALARRKGIDLLARAVALRVGHIQVVLAGSVEKGFEQDLESHCEQMRAAGAQLDLRAWSHSESEGLKALSEAKCALLPYPRHYGMSRILLEACHAGTPVIATREGYLGHLVDRYRIGVSVDCNDAGALRNAILDMCNGSKRDEYVPHLKSFAERYSSRCFENSLAAPFMRAAGDDK